MAGWIERLTGSRPNSAGLAKERLKLVLIHDRTDLSPDEVSRLKDDLLAVIQRYVDIDPSAVRIVVNQEGREQRLIADIPIRSQHKQRIG